MKHSSSNVIISVRELDVSESGKLCEMSIFYGKQRKIMQKINEKWAGWMGGPGWSSLLRAPICGAIEIITSGPKPTISR